MKTSACFHYVFVAVAGAALAEACSPAGPDTHGANVPRCDAEERPALDCTSEFKYDGRRIEGGFSAVGLGGANAKTDEQALRAIDKETEQYVAESRRLCDEYNKCVLDKQTYATRSENLRRRMSKAPELLDEVKAATDESARRKALAKAYTMLVPDENRRELALDFSVLVQKPDEAAARPISRGERLPTGSRLAFTLLPSRRAYVYLFQRGPDGKINVLFPDARIATGNPIPPGAALRIPSGAAQMYKLNDKDVGNETVYIVASLDAIDSLGGALDRTGSGGQPMGPISQVTDATSDAPGCTRALELEETPKCVRQRGLELEAGSEPAAAPSSFRARTEAADSVIVQAFSFTHTP